VGLIWQSGIRGCEGRQNQERNEEMDMYHLAMCSRKGRFMTTSCQKKTATKTLGLMAFRQLLFEDGNRGKVCVQISLSLQQRSWDSSVGVMICRLDS
jgi:hypothetical protein